MSVAERSLLEGGFSKSGKWIGTRFWFYPDSISVESDLSYEYAKITRPQFMADAERSREDFASPEEFERKKRATLLPSVRKNIEHLNQNYPLYANAYPEIRELTTVARLMGICSWLRRAKPGWLDLDALLSVELPSHRTERDKEQLMSTTQVAFATSDGLSSEYVRTNCTVVRLNPTLEKKIGRYFRNADNLAKYLCYAKGVSNTQYYAYRSEAHQIMSTYSEKKVGHLIRTQEDLRALTNYAADRMKHDLPSEARDLERQISKDEDKLRRLQAEITAVREKMEKDTWTHNAYVTKHNDLVDKFESTGLRHNRNVDAFNRLEFRNICQIGGGINLEPKLFNVRKTATSKALNQFKSVTQKTGSEWKSINGSGEWIRSEARRGGSSVANDLPEIAWTAEVQKKANGSAFQYLKAGAQQNYWTSTESETGSWRDLHESGKGQYRERFFEGSSNKLHVAQFASGKLEDNIVGQKINENLIVFSKSSRKDVMQPQEPPLWWETQ